MLIFAYIIWIYLIIRFVIRIILLIVCNYKNQKYQIDIEELAFEIGIFTFLTMYIFPR